MKRERLENILRLLLEQEGYRSAGDLAKNLNVSVRTIYNDFESREFHALLHGASLDKIQNQGIALHATKAQKERIYYELSSSEEKKLVSTGNDMHTIILFLLINIPPLSIDELSSLLYKSKNSIAQILNQAEEYVTDYACHIERKPNYGISLQGEEQALRRLFKKELMMQMDIEEDYIAYLKEVFTTTFIDSLIDILHLSEHHMATQYTEYDFHILLTKYVIIIKRNLLQHPLTSAPSFDTTLQEFYIAAIIKMKIEEVFHITLSKEEHNALAQAILATRKTVNQGLLTPSFNEDVIDNFISKISIHLDVDLKKNEELKINLINHLKPAIRRIRHGSATENPMLNHIRFKFTYVYIAVMITIDEIEKQEHIFFDANELSFICLHIVAALNREKSAKVVTALLISNDGLTLNTYIKSCLESNFSELNILRISTSEELPSINYTDYDLMLNTTTKQIDAANSISINSIIEDTDFAKIRHWLYYQELENAMSMKEHLKDYILMFHDEAIDKFTLLEKYSRYLVETGFVAENFYDSVVEREKRSTTSIGRGVAVPHGSPELVNKPVILIIHTKTPIIWDELHVDMIFLTAIDEGHSSSYHYFFKQLFHIVEDEKQLNQLKHSSNQEDIEKLLFPEK